MQSPIQFSCIIPFYNEGERVLSVLKLVHQIPQFSQIICIDDGSTDKISNQIQQHWPNVELIILPQNEGKSSAIRNGLKAVKSTFVFLMDADLRFLDNAEILRALNIMQQQPFIDMLILRRVKAPWYFKIDRRDLLFSGERILRKTDLDDVLRSEVWRYQLEIAINQYMIKHHKVVRWMPWSAFNTHKAIKWGFFNGFKKEMMMFKDMIIFGGVTEYLKQIFIFARKGI